MGQRHQAFVIARIVPHGETKAIYRCVGAFHHQWCYGRLPLKALWRFLTLIRIPDNAKVIRQELKAIQGKYGKVGDMEPKIPDVPCPYLIFLLGTAWNICLAKSPYTYFSGVSDINNNILDAPMGCFDGDNDDGITIIDVTDPYDPAYCMSMYSRMPKPITGEQYCRRYYDVPSAKEMEEEDSVTSRTENDVIGVINLLATERLLTLEVLAEAWPREFGNSYAASKNADASPTGDTAAPDTAATPIPSLADLAVAPAVEEALKSGETDSLSTLFILPGKTKLIKRVLCTQQVVTDSAISLLASVLSHELENKSVDIDLTGLTCWSDAQITQVLSSISEDLLTNVKLIDLSYNPQISSCDVVEQVLTRMPLLKRLDLLDTSIDIPAISSLITTKPELFKHLETLLHPALFQIDKTITHKGGFSCIALSGLVEGSWHVQSVSAYVPIWTPATVVQGITDVVSVLSGSEDIYSFTYSFFNSVALQAALSGGLRADEKDTVDHRRVSLVPGSSTAGFTGAGWMFILSCGDQYAVNCQWLYGFAKLDADEAGLEPAVDDMKICDLRGFLQEMEKEERPPPSDAAIDKLEHLLHDLCTPSQVVPGPGGMGGVNAGGLIDANSLEQAKKASTSKKGYGFW